MFESPSHWLVVAIVALVLFFGWKQLPDMARSVGRSLRIFKTEMKGMTQDDKARAEAEPAADQPAAPRALPAAEVVPNRPAERPSDEAPARPRPRPAPGRTAAADGSAADRRADAS